MSTCNVFLSETEINGLFQLQSIIIHLNPQQEPGTAWQKMSPVTLDDNCAKMKAAETVALLSFPACNVTALEMHMQDEGFCKWLPTQKIRSSLHVFTWLERFMRCMCLEKRGQKDSNVYSVAFLEAYRCMLPFEPAVQRIPMVLMVTDFWWQMTISVCLCVQDGVNISSNEDITVKREDVTTQPAK